MVIMKNLTPLILSLFLLTDCDNIFADTQLKLMEEYTIDASELSGLAWRKDPETGKRDLIAVGDRNHALYLIDWENRKYRSNIEVKKIGLDFLKPEDLEEQSEWESVFSDSTGRVFIISESPAKILVISNDFTKLDHVVELSQGTGDDNQGYEGLLLLSNGHILAVKEKEPIQIIEYGPKNSKAQGYTTKFNIERNGMFPINKEPLRQQYFPLKKWSAEEGLAKLMGDTSGINVDINGNLYLLSDEERLIVKIGSSLSPKEETFAMVEKRTFPSALKRPEGMVIDNNNQVLIAIDKKKPKKPNLFLYSPI